MKNYILLLLVVLSFSISSCGKDDGGVDVFIPNLSNGFFSQADNNLLFFIRPEKKNVNESDFSGDYTGNNVAGDLAGHFKNYDISFKITNGDDKDVTYTGKFIKGDPLKIQLHGTNNKDLTLIQF